MKKRKKKKSKKRYLRKKFKRLKKTKLIKNKKRKKFSISKKISRNKIKSISKKIKRKKFKQKKAIKIRKKLTKKNQKTRVVIKSILNLSNKIKSIFKINFNLDQSLQNFFIGVSSRVSNFKKVLQEEREKQKQLKINAMEREKSDLQKKLKLEGDLALKLKNEELKGEIKLKKDRQKDLKYFLRQEQAEVRKEQAERQRKFLEQIKLEKKIEQFRKREANEIRSLEKFVLSQERENYVEVKNRIDAIKKRYQELRDQKIRERVEQLGVVVQESDDRATLLEKEKVYYLERQKIEFALESFWRSAHSLCFQLNRKYVPKYLSIFRCLDFRMERGEILIKFDDAPENEFLILIYLDSKSSENIIIEDKSNPDKNISKEFKPSEIFQASDMMVESLTQLLDRERNKRRAS